MLLTELIVNDPAKFSQDLHFYLEEPDINISKQRPHLSRFFESSPQISPQNRPLGIQNEGLLRI